MEQISEFLGNHSGLVFAAVLIVIGLVINELILRKRSGARLNASEAVRLINDSDAVVVDLRNVADFKRGHIVNAVNVPVTKLGDQMQTLKKHKDKPILLCCAMGSASVGAGTRLREAGFGDVRLLSGGVSAWQAAGLPLVK